MFQRKVNIMLNCLIVDDEPLARKELSSLIQEYECIDKVYEAENALMALDIIIKKNIDVMFLDIEMPQVNGIEFAEVLKEYHQDITIIIVSAYEKYAIDAFKVNAIDYLLKPIDTRALDKTIKDKLIPHLNNKQQVNSIDDVELYMNAKTNVPKITVTKDDRYIPLNYSKIIYITIEDRKTLIYTRNQTYTMNQTLSEILESLNDSRFFRTHKSYIVNIHYIESIEPWFNATLKLKVKSINDSVPVSRSYVKSFKSMLNID